MSSNLYQNLMQINVMQFSIKEARITCVIHPWHHMCLKLRQIKENLTGISSLAIFVVQVYWRASHCDRKANGLTSGKIQNTLHVDKTLTCNTLHCEQSCFFVSIWCLYVKEIKIYCLIWVNKIKIKNMTENRSLLLFWCDINSILNAM